MSRLECKCGHTLWNGETPNNIEYWVYSDKTIDSILKSDVIDTLALNNLFDYNIWRCPECKRLYIFNKNESVPKYVYTQEK